MNEMRTYDDDGAAVGLEDGAALGAPDGAPLGALLGLALGEALGLPLGAALGAAEGAAEGASLGAPLGAADGAEVRTTISDCSVSMPKVLFGNPIDAVVVAAEVSAASFTKSATSLAMASVKFAIGRSEAKAVIRV